MLKKIFSIFFFLFFIFGFTFSQTGENIGTGQNSVCKDLKSKFILQTPDVVKVGFPVEFYIEGLTGKNIVTWSFYKQGKKVFSYKGSKLSYEFKNPGEVLLEASFNYNKCDIVLEKDVIIYRKVILTLLKKKDITSFISTFNLKSKGIYFQNVSLEDLENNSYLLQISDYVIIDQENVINFFSILPKNKLYVDKKFILLIDSFRGFFSKLIIPYVKGVYANNIYIYSSNDLLNILGYIYQGKELDKANLLTTSSAGDKFYLPLSYFVNQLISVGVDVNILAIVLIALLGTIIVAFFRQIIGFSVFGVYTPLIFSIMYIVLGFKLLFILFILAIIAQLLTYLITKKVYILYSSKISLAYIIYVIISIIVIGLLVKFGILDNLKVDNSIILAYFIMPLLTKNLVKEETSIFSKSFWLFILEFIFIVGILLFLYHINFLKYLLIAYPDLLWIFIILVILIGRFTGLQLLEYIRFYPLIKKSLHEEE